MEERLHLLQLMDARPKRARQQPTPVIVRGPFEDLVDTAIECIQDGTFDSFFRQIKEQLVIAAKTGNRASCSYYTRAFCAFLHAQGGSYSLGQTESARTRPLPPIVFTALLED